MTSDKPLTCCNELTTWDENSVGTTCGGLEVIGAYVCGVCGTSFLGKASHPTDPNESEVWKMNKGGRSVDIGQVRLRAESTRSDVDIPSLMTRIARLPRLEQALRTIAAGARDSAGVARRALDEDMDEGPIESFKGVFRFLSNFYPCAIRYSGNLYPTAEHAYQAAKTLDPQERLAVRSALTPGQAKKLGQRVTLQPGWDDLKDEVMRIILADKFTRNPELGMALKATKDRELIEGNTWGDVYWGVCGGMGENRLGQILMEVRHFLQAGER
jgi:ribA/ribD-fused uncharacterized protein